MAASVCIPTNSAPGFPFLHILASIHFCGFIDYSHSGRYKVISHCSFNLHCLMISNIEHLFICLWAVCMSSLDVSIPVLRLFFNWIVFSWFLSLSMRLSSVFLFFTITLSYHVTFRGHVQVLLLFKERWSTLQCY